MSTTPITDRPVRWGVIGPGRIAETVIGDLALLPGEGVLQSVASRDLGRARDFAGRHAPAGGPTPAAYGSYAELLADPDVDCVYLATPHRQHHGIALAAIAAGKHLLVEKAFTCTLAGTREVVDAARASGLFVMEAMWTRFQPAVVRLRELIAGGAIGEVRTAHADLGLRAAFDPTDRLWDPAQGGGALLDLGVYPVAWMQMLFGGDPTALDVAGAQGPNGVDAEATLMWHAEGGRVGVGACSLVSALPGRASIFGTDGWIEVAPRFHHPVALTVHRTVPGERVATVPDRMDLPALGAGYSHMLQEVHRCLADGRTESDVMPLDDTVAVMAVLEAALHALDVHPDEDPAPL